jgi:hypothetical protein
MLDYPVTNFEMPPDVEVENRKLQLECEGSYPGQQRDQRG